MTKVPEYTLATTSALITANFRGLTIVRTGEDARQQSVTVTVNGTVVHSDKRGSAAVTAASALISELVKCKNARAKLLEIKRDAGRSGVSISEIDDRIAFLGKRSALALEKAKLAGVPDAWLVAAAPKAAK